jgi:hypothetical protein
MKKLKEIFIKENKPCDITPCYHGFGAFNMIKNKVITAIIPLNFVLMILRSLYWAVRFAGQDMDRFYTQQIKLRSKNER